MCVDANKDVLFRLLASAIQDSSPHSQNAISSPIYDVSRRSRHTASVSCLPFVSSHIVEDDSSNRYCGGSRNCCLLVMCRSTLRYTPCHLIEAECIYTEAWVLLLMDFISGCDTVSTFYRIGKKTAWVVWRSMPHLNQSLITYLIL